MTKNSKQFLEKANAVIGKEQYKSLIVSSNHVLIGDEEKENGGMALGMNPLSLLLSALASCTLSTLRKYADNRYWPMEGAEVEVILWKIEDCVGKRPQITSELNLFGPLSERQKKKLLNVAKFCFISRTLQGGLSLKTSVGDTTV